MQIWQLTSLLGTLSPVWSQSSLIPNKKQIVDDAIKVEILVRNTSQYVLSILKVVSISQ